MDDGHGGNGMDGEVRVDDGKEGAEGGGGVDDGKEGGGGVDDGKEEGGGGVDDGQAAGIWKIPLLSDLGGSGPGGSSRHAESLIQYCIKDAVRYGVCCSINV